tara:strand:+ start:609 stop:896 length:288 start_codon:yes stop_codon:yes gene_type:complete
MHALKFRFRTPEWRSCWLYVTADPDPDPSAATLKAHRAALPDLVAVLDRSHAFLAAYDLAGRSREDLELGSVDLDPATRKELPDTFSRIGITDLS